MTDNPLFRLLDNLPRAQRRRNEFHALMGDGKGNLYPTDPSGDRLAGYVWIRMQMGDGTDLTPRAVMCRRVARKYGLPVIVGYNADGVLEVVEEDSLLANEFTGGRGAQTAEHAWIHKLTGPDPLYVDGLQIRPLGVHPDEPSPSLNVVIEPCSYVYGGTIKHYAGQTLDLTSYVPGTASQQVAVVIALNPATNAAVVVSGTAITPFIPGSSTMPFTASDLTAISTTAGHVRLVGVRLYNGQTKILWHDFIADLRNHVIITDHAGLSGTGTGDPHSGYILLAPASSTRNVIQPIGAAVIPLIVRGAASQSANLQEWQNSTPTILGYIDNAGGAKFPSLGIASANPNPTLYGVNINKTITDDTAVRHSGIEGVLLAAPSINSAGAYVGAIFDARLTTNVNLTKTLGGLIGFEGLPRHQGSGIVTSVVSVLVDGPVVSGGGTITTWNGIAFSAASVTSGSVTNAVAIEVRDIAFGATLNIALRTNAGSVIFNEGGDANADLRIEGDTDVNLLFTDASTDRVGIGLALPTTKGHILLTDAGTAAVVNVLTVGHDSTGTPAAGFGAGLIFEGESSTTPSQSMGRITAEWVVATHASRTARMKFTAFDAAGEREAIRIESNGSAPMLGLFGVNAVVRPTALTAQLTTITHTAPGTPDYAIQDLTQTTPFGFATKDEGNTVLSVVANLQTRVGELETKLQAVGAIT